MKKQIGTIKIALNDQNFDIVAEYVRSTSLTDIRKYVQLDKYPKGILVAEDTPIEIIFRLGYIAGLQSGKH